VVNPHRAKAEKVVIRETRCIQERKWLLVELPVRS